MIKFENMSFSAYGDNTIHQRIAKQARRTPEATAVVYEGACLTYGQLEEQSNRMAKALRKRGIGRGGIVGILMERSPQILIAMLGVLKAGGAYLPLDPEFPSERLAYMLEDSKAQLLIVSPETEGQVKFDGNIMRIDDEEWTLEDSSTIEAQLESGNDLAYLMYTSGSTGRPKGVMIEHASVCNLIEGITERIDFSAGRTILGLTTISFDIFVLETWLPLSCGMTVILAGKRHQKDPWELGKLLEESGVQMMQATPSRMNWLMHAAGGGVLAKAGDDYGRRRRCSGGIGRTAAESKWCENLQYVRAYGDHGVVMLRRTGSRQGGNRRYADSEYKAVRCKR
ncbi:hypothetical protein PCURB6_11530 [Paenibacillus curdlanolyticus]|nr:hypothetical protein PCURB6_11530 [Paenibacillus curdlanolyticus]